MSNPNESCEICRQAALRGSEENPFFIHEFEHSIFVVGSHQFHKGYCLLLFKEHVRELHELKSPVQTALFQELMLAARAVAETFKPWKMNYSCYGNVVPHIHWHLFPRYDSDPDHLAHPWLHAAKFGEYPTDAATARDLAQKIKANLPEK